MNHKDRTFIHEAMEQQSISIAKAGIVTTLKTRCGVIAALNPVGDRYDISKNFYDNSGLTEPILSRFDLLCVVRDIVDKTLDEKTATFIIKSHILSHPLNENKNLVKEENNSDLVSQEQLKKYILYARTYIKPNLDKANKDKLVNFYAEIRKQGQITGGIQITPRHLESLIRIAEAHSKIYLRQHVNRNDVDFSIQMVLECFLQNQKYYIQKLLRKKLSY